MNRVLKTAALAGAPCAAPCRLVAVVVTRNRLAALKVTLARLLDSPPAELAAVVVVDNASSDGTGSWLSAVQDPRVDVLSCAVNGGGAGGFEAGMQRAMRRHAPDWLVLMDDDSRPSPGGLGAFHALPKARWDAVAAAVYFPTGEICDMNRPSRNPFRHPRAFLRTLLRGRAGFHLQAGDYSGPAVQVDVTSFVGFFVSAAAVRQAGYPDPALFLYGDDGLYTLGLTEAGGRIGFEPSVRFEHALTTFGPAGAQMPVQRGRFRPLWKAYYYHRNLLLLYRKAAGWLFWPACLVVLPKWLYKTRHHRGARRIFLRLLGLAVWDGLRRHTGRPHARILALGSGLSRSESPGDSGG